MTVYDQLQNLLELPRAYEDWREYREKLTNWIISVTEENTTALIVGAGACNDYDLSRLASHFSKLSLLDLDEKSMRNAANRQISNHALRDKLAFIEGDVVGIPEESYRQFSAKLQEMVNVYGVNTDMDALAELALCEMEAAYASRMNPGHLFPKNSVDYCIACGVHSQLGSMYPWIWESFCTALGKKDSRVHLRARAFLDSFIPQFHDFLFSSARKGVLLGLEEARIGIEGGVEGAIQGIRDIKNHREQILAETTLLWPFDLRQQIIYLMHFYLCTAGCFIGNTD